MVARLVGLVGLVGLMLLGSIAFAHGHEYSIQANLKKPSQEVQCVGSGEVINKYMWERLPSNQMGLGICYAHVAASLYAAVYHSHHHQGIDPSPLMLSLYENILGRESVGFLTAPWYKKAAYLFPLFGWEYYLLAKHEREASLLERIEGGTILNALRAAGKTAACPKAAVEDFLDFGRDLYIPAQALELMYTFTATYWQQSRLARGKGLQALFADSLAMLKGSYSPQVIWRLRELQAYLAKQGFVRSPNPTRAYIKRTVVSFFMQRCKDFAPQPQLSKLALQIKIFQPQGNHRKFAEVLDQHFVTTQALPVGLTFCAGHLEGESKCGAHAAFIYGKKCEKGRLRALVRNSWGGLSLKQQRAKRRLIHQDKSDDLRYRIGGDFWIPVDVLTQYMVKTKHGITFVKG